MGRDSGFVARNAALSNNVVDACLIPEIPFEVHGDGGFLEWLLAHLERCQHAVVVISEAAAQEHVPVTGKDSTVLLTLLPSPLHIYGGFSLHKRQWKPTPHVQPSACVCVNSPGFRFTCSRDGYDSDDITKVGVGGGVLSQNSGNREPEWSGWWSV